MKSKLSYENISQSFGSSFTIRRFDGSAKNVYPSWHYHPELELVYIRGGSGRRHIGTHQSGYRNGDLILLGANLPHYGFTDSHSGNEAETVIQFTQDFMGSYFLQAPEMRSVALLLEQAKYGIVFSKKTKNELGPRIESLVDLAPFPRFLAFIRILKDMAISEDFTLLNESKAPEEEAIKHPEKIDAIFGIVRKDFQQDISLSEIASQHAMTVPAFCRYFKKQSGKTFTHFVNEFRIIHACKLLSETSLMITEIAAESGFPNFSHFTRQFKKFTGKTPSAYRQEFRQLID